jgi:hypothetical protein
VAFAQAFSRRDRHERASEIVCKGSYRRDSTDVVSAPVAMVG